MSRIYSVYRRVSSFKPGPEVINVHSKWASGNATALQVSKAGDPLATACLVNVGVFTMEGASVL